VESLYDQPREITAPNIKSEKSDADFKYFVGVSTTSSAYLHNQNN